MDQGTYITPDPDGEENNPYYDTVVYEDTWCLINTDEKWIGLFEQSRLVL